MHMHRTSLWSTQPHVIAIVALAGFLAIAVGAVVGSLGGGHWDATRLTLLSAVCIPALLAACVRPDLLTYAGIALVSSDRLLTVNVSYLTIRPSHLMFTAALAGVLLRPTDRNAFRRPGIGDRGFRRLLVALAVLIATQVLSMFFSGLSSPSTMAARVMVMIGGAVIPLMAIVLTLNTTERFRTGVSVFVLSEVVVACYGLYQLGAGYAGLPQGLTYSVIAGGAGRISALSAEPGFYAPYLVLALPLTTYLVLSKRAIWSVSPVFIGAILLTTLVLANSRAGYLSGLCALGLALWMFAPRAAGGPYRFIRLGLVAVGATVAVVLASQAAGVSIEHTLGRQFTTSFHANADASTVERTDLYHAASQIFLDHPILGVGDGNATPILPSYGVLTFVDRPEASILSVPFEVAAESGVIGLLALAGLYWQFGRLTFSRRWNIPEADAQLVRALFLGAFVFLVVNGLFLTWLWDARLWFVVGLAFAGVLAREGNLREA